MRFLDIVWKVLGVRVLEPRWHESVRQRLLTARGPRVETRKAGEGGDRSPVALRWGGGSSLVPEQL